MSSSSRSAFTLIELLIVIAIVGILSLVVILVINPVDLLRQARDTTRLSDLDTLNHALNLYQVDVISNGSLGSASTTYISVADTTATTTAGTNCAGLGLPSVPPGWSYHCAASSTLKNVDGTGWLPVNFTQASFGSPLGVLPLDPVNTLLSRNYYTYTPGGSWELASSFESSKYKLAGSADRVTTDGGQYPDLYETGSNLTLLPVDYGDSSLVGYWKLDDGVGTSTYDGSGNAKTGTLTNGPLWVTAGNCKRGGCLSFDGTDDYVSVVSPSTPASLSACAWVSSPTPSGSKDPEGIYNILSGDGILNYVVISTSLFRVFDGTSWRTGSPTILANTWYHLCLTFDASSKTLFLYTNGTSQYSGTVTSPGSFTGTLTLIGKTNGGLRYLDGKLDDIRIYNRVLSGAEIAGIYSATK